MSWMPCYMSALPNTKFLYCPNGWASLWLQRWTFLAFLVTARNEVGARLCLYTCLWFCSRGGSARHPPPGADTPLHSACWDMVNKRAVRILLECILVMQMLLFVFDELNVIEKSFWYFFLDHSNLRSSDEARNYEPTLSTFEQNAVLAASTAWRISAFLEGILDLIQ